jgi:hypothetical protein
VVDQEVPEHAAAEGPADERHHCLSPIRPLLSPKRMCERNWTLPGHRPMHRPLPCCPWARALGTGRRAENHVPLDAATGGTHLAANGPSRGLHGHHAGIEPVCPQPPGAWVDHLQVPRGKAAPFPCRRQLSLIDRMAATWRISPKLSLLTRVKPAPRASQVAAWLPGGRI